MFWTVAIAVSNVPQRLDHYTWWAVVLQAVCIAANRGFRSALAVHALVIGGVWVMSAVGCDMLVDTEKEVGFLAYAGGNFILHYLPFVSALARVSADDVCTPFPMILWLLYILHVGNVTDEYGCTTVNERLARAAGCGIVVCMAAL